MNKFEGFALDVVLSDYPDGMNYEEIIAYLNDGYDSDEDPELFVLEEFEHERGEQIAQRIEDMRQTAFRWFGDHNQISVKWHVTDVLGVAEQIGVNLTDDEAREVLRRVINHHDATVGINWDVIADHIETLKDSERL